MIDDGRRTFLKECAAFAAAASTPLNVRQSLAVNIPGSSRPAAQHIAYVLIDERVEEACAFAASLRAAGASVLSAIQTDLAELWRSELRSACLEGNAIAGLTAHSALFVCAGLGREHGVRVRHEAQHDCRGGLVLSHRLPAGQRPPGFDGLLAQAGAGWPQVLAGYLAGLPSKNAHLHAAHIQTSARRSATHPGTLFSWLIG